MNTDIECYSDEFGPRVALVFPFDPEAQADLKSALGFPDCKFNGQMKCWTISDTKECRLMASSVLKPYGYDFSHHLLDGVEVQSYMVHGCSARIDDGQLVLRWPYIQDETHRKNVLNAVKSIAGRKFDGDSKVWRIPLGQASHLHKLLTTTYPPLAEVIKMVPEVEDYITQSIERVALSQAKELTPELVNEMETRLLDVFPSDLTLYPFQYVGVAFAEASNGRCLIGDDLGLGKTIQAISYCILHPEHWPVLVVAPANVKWNWKNELNKWLPDVTCDVVDGGKHQLTKADFTIINYDLINKKKKDLLKQKYQTLVIDECHRLSNSATQRSKATLEVSLMAKSIICLSGTPITNRPKEFFTTLNLVRPEQFPDMWAFKKQYCDLWHNGYGWDDGGASNLKELNERTRDCVLRRLKKEVLPELPDKVRMFLPVKLKADARKTYEQARMEWMTQYELYLNHGGMPSGFALNMLTQLRHICGKLKVDAASEYILAYLEQTKKPMVVYIHHLDVCEMLCEQLNKNDLAFASITGQTSANKRTRIVSDFQEGLYDVLVCSTIAAKEGITLTRADTVLFLEREWVPGWEEQAEDRVLRIGQESDSVQAVYLSCINTIDEHFDRVVEEKRAVIKQVVDGGEEMERSTLIKELLTRLEEQGSWS